MWERTVLASLREKVAFSGRCVSGAQMPVFPISTSPEPHEEPCPWSQAVLTSACRSRETAAALGPPQGASQPLTGAVGATVRAAALRTPGGEDFQLWCHLVCSQRQTHANSTLLYLLSQDLLPTPTQIHTPGTCSRPRDLVFSAHKHHGHSMEAEVTTPCPGSHDLLT